MESAAGHLDPRLQDALRAAHLYYVQDLKMEAIATELRTSRSSVSRMLSHARASGLVEIRIHSPLSEPGRLEQALSSRYGIAAHVVPVPDRADDADRLDRVARAAARFTAALFSSNMSLGLAWGATTEAISRFLPRKRTTDTKVVQLNGAATHRAGPARASDVLRRFGDAFGSQVQQFPVPAFFDDPATRQAMWRERGVRRLLDAQHRIDIAVFGIGSLPDGTPGSIDASGDLDHADRAALSSSGVVGDVATVFLRADGSSDGIPLNERSSGPDLRFLRSVPRRVCAVAGLPGLDGLRGALAAGLISDLVLDERTARAL